MSAPDYCDKLFMCSSVNQSANSWTAYLGSSLTIKPDWEIALISANLDGFKKKDYTNFHISINNLDIASDSLYDSSGNALAHKALYYHSGKWSTQEDNVLAPRDPIYREMTNSTDLTISQFDIEIRDNASGSLVTADATHDDAFLVFHIRHRADKLLAFHQEATKDAADLIKSSCDTIATNVSTVDTSIGTLNSSVNTVDSSIGTLDATCLQIKNATDDVKAAVDLVKTATDTVDTSIGSVNSNILALDTNVQTVNSSIGTLDATCLTIKNATDDVKSSVDLVKSAVDTVDTSVGSLNSSVMSVDTSVQAVDSSIQTLDTSVQTVDSSINTLDTSVGLVKTAVDENKAQIRYKLIN